MLQTCSKRQRAEEQWPELKKLHVYLNPACGVGPPCDTGPGPLPASTRGAELEEDRDAVGTLLTTLLAARWGAGKGAEVADLPDLNGQELAKWPKFLQL